MGHPLAAAAVVGRCGGSWTLRRRLDDAGLPLAAGHPLAATRAGRCGGIRWPGRELDCHDRAYDECRPLGRMHRRGDRGRRARAHPRARERALTPPRGLAQRLAAWRSAWRLGAAPGASSGYGGRRTPRPPARSPSARASTTCSSRSRRLQVSPWSASPSPRESRSCLRRPAAGCSPLPRLTRHRDGWPGLRPPGGTAARGDRVGRVGAAAAPSRRRRH